MGAAAPGGACQRDAAATVALVWSPLSCACPSAAHGAVSSAWAAGAGVDGARGRIWIPARNAQLWQLPSLLPPVPRERDPGVLLRAAGTGAGPQPGHEPRQPPRLQLPWTGLHHEPCGAVSLPEGLGHVEGAQGWLHGVPLSEVSSSTVIPLQKWNHSGWKGLQELGVQPLTNHQLVNWTRTLSAVSVIS